MVVTNSFPTNIRGGPDRQLSNKYKGWGVTDSFPTNISGGV